MHTRSFITASALLLAALGCRDDARSPTGPGVAPQADVAAATALSFLADERRDEPHLRDNHGQPGLLLGQ
jgi:hypothetical protein